MINIYVAGQPVGKARPRVTRSGRVYTPTKTMKAEASIQDAAREAMQGQQPMEGPVYVSAAFNMQIPISWTKTKRQQAGIGSVMPAGKPDIDNLAKTVMDALNGIAYRDDSQVVQLAISKRYSDEPGTFITIRPA
jgi:Holliday junction resolvase RusA-like endonuclease